MKRSSTREICWRERYTFQRQGTLKQIISLATLSSHQNPNAVALFRRKRARKIPNFIVLILGPRGKT